MSEFMYSFLNMEAFQELLTGQLSTSERICLGFLMTEELLHLWRHYFEYKVTISKGNSLSHFFKKGDYLIKISSGDILIILDLFAADDRYFTNIIYDGYGNSYKDDFLDLPIYLEPEEYIILSELHKALL
jgi:hypothetical protein